MSNMSNIMTLTDIQKQETERDEKLKTTLKLVVRENKELKFIVDEISKNYKELEEEHDNTIDEYNKLGNEYEKIQTQIIEKKKENDRLSEETRRLMTELKNEQLIKAKKINESDSFIRNWINTNLTDDDKKEIMEKYAPFFPLKKKNKKIDKIFF